MWFTSIQAGNTACNHRTHYHLVLSHKTYQNQGICYVTKTFVARNKFAHVKVARNTKKVGQACSICYTVVLERLLVFINFSHSSKTPPSFFEMIVVFQVFGRCIVHPHRPSLWCGQRAARTSRTVSRRSRFHVPLRIPRNAAGSADGRR